MKGSIPFLNFSLRKVLAQEPDSLKRARIKIVFTTLALLILKIVILVPLVFHDLKDHQLYRLLFVFILYIGLTKYLLYKPSRLTLISHAIILTGVLGVWSTLFVFGQRLNLLTIQFVFMVIFVGYYLIDRGFAVIYSSLSIVAVMLYLVMRNRVEWHLDISSQELPSPGFEAIVLMNFATMVLIHYLFYQAFKENVEEKEALNKQLEAIVAETRALADSRSVFLSTMSHELRTPLNAVIGMTNLVKDTASEEQLENLDILEFSAVSLLTLVNDILDYNKSENDKIELELIPVNLAALLHKVCYGLQQRAAEKGFGLVLSIDEQLKEQWVITDPTRLTQIIYNLAGNAIKFTEYGQVTVNAAITNIHSDQLSVEFTITDTGIGIPADRQQAIFDPFVQASADTTRHYGGTGLGLAIVKRLLGLFNTTVQLKSEAGKGSAFSFSVDFELYKGDAKPVPAHPALEISLKGLQILIAEDNPINALLLVKLLSKWHVNTDVAKNGQEAVDKFANGVFDAILMDLHMPIMDGYQATEVIREFTDREKAGVPIIALTASVSHNIYDKIKDAGMNDYLSKPFQSAALYQKLEVLNTAKIGKITSEGIQLDTTSDSMPA
ncbi:ATP-binding protein [Mucilaginibacter glaciei]|uniref:histidine kinase n=1 Tax=Mucilaginibacter glaciei TaxID=2772109 RepID=A0A926NRZ9_9SPHI|nr:ATP-binding protein [Mucilaginibacter glaciei]MBD1392850.1 response regulator [Mucilaginibacter glaciei]